MSIKQNKLLLRSISVISEDNLELCVTFLIFCTVNLLI